MKLRLSSCAAVVVLALYAISLSAGAQTIVPTSPYKDKPTPRTADDHPDLTGVFYPGDPYHHDVRRPVRRFDAETMKTWEKPSFQPWAREKIKLMGPIPDVQPCLDCEPLGATGMFLKGEYSIQLVQSPGQLVVLSELDTTFRVIPTDGRPHPKDPDPQFNGNAVGHWEGDTLVVDVVAVDVHNWVGFVQGWFVSDVVHYIERFSRPTANVFIYQFTVDDPKVLTKPWTSPPDKYLWTPDMQIYEYYCTYNQDSYQLGQASKVKLTPEGADERYFDEQEYERLRAQYNK